MGRGKSRPKRWSEALSEMQSGFNALQSLQEEYQEWKDNLPENLQSSALGEKLQTIEDLDFDALDSSMGDLETALTDIQEKLDELDGVELPLGFGRD